MKKISIFLMLLMGVLFPWTAQATDLANYLFSTGQNQSKWITLSSNATELVASGQDDEASSLTNIGFASAFQFGNETYNQFWANSNGIFSFSSTPATSYSNQFNSSNYTANQPKICGVTRDMSTGNNGYVKYELTGTAPNRIMVCEFYLNGSGYSTSTSATIKWQVQLYEADSKVAIVYGDTPSSIPSSYQIGLSASSSDIVLVNPSTHTATPTNTYNNSTYSIWPGAYRYYEFVVPTDPYITLAPQAATVLTGFTETLTATYGNVSGTPTITYSSSNTNVATVSGSGTTATVTAVAPGTATITVTMNGSYTATCAITVEDPHVCTPTFSGSYTTYYISNFTTTGANTNINNSTSGTGLSYSDFYSSYSASVSAGQTINFTITIAGGSTYGSAIWVDWNNDLEFSDAERVHQTSGYLSSPHNGSFTVPADATFGEYRMRVVTDYLSSTPSNPCSASTGEFEDYKLTISSTPYITLNPSAATVFTGFTETLTATYGNVSGTPTITYSTSDDSVASVIGNGTTATVTGVAPGTATITATMTVNGTNYTGTCDIIVEDPSYCTPGPTSIDGSGISNVTFGTTSVVNDNLSMSGSPYYYNHSNKIGDAEAGSTVSMSITYATDYTYYTWVWVDWNKDYEFDDTELVYPSSQTISSGVLSIQFNVPSSVTPGDYRMRIQGADGSSKKNPCFTGTYSYLVDYTLRVAIPASCPSPTPGSVSNLMPTSATLNWTSDADDFYARYRVAAHEETTFFDDFESGDLNGWTVYTNGQSLLDLGLSYEGWFVYNLGVNHGDGSYVANAWSYYELDDEYGTFDADNWLITPQVTLGGTLKFWVWANYSDEFEVLLSTSGTATSSFTTTLRSLQAPSATSTWEEVTVDLSDYSGQGYIAIHHVFEDGWYLLVDDFGIYVNEPAGQWLPNNSGEYSATTSLDIDHLTPETEYEWQVMADCGSTDGVSAWSSIATFTTPSACAAPSAPNTTDITAVSAKLNWTGAQENYNVSYGKVFFYEDFENGLPSTWTIIDSDGDGNNWYGADNEYNYAHNGTHMVVSASYSGSALTPDNWLITPQLELKGTMSVWLRNQDPGYPETFAIYLSTNSTNVSDFTTTLVAETNALGEYTEYTADLSSYNGQQGYIAIRHFNCTDKFRLVLDDFGIYDLQSTTSTASNVTVNGLEPMTEYIWKVQGDDCDGNGSTTDWSDYVFFTTAEGYIKHIEAYDGANWYLIASPLAAETNPTDVGNLIPANASNYALYRFNENPTVVNGVGNEWENYKAHTSDFVLEPGRGYLYGNSTEGGVDLIFTGAAYDGDSKDVTLSKTAGAEFEGMNLVGNPFAVKAYIGRDFYTMNPSGTGIMTQLSSGAIGAMEGVFVEANQDNEILTFTTQAPAGNKGLILNLSEGRGVVDRAVIRFGEGHRLHKFMLNENSTKMYIPEDGEDFAVVRSRNSGEVTVNFEPAEDGVYSLSINAENLAVRTLILTDKVERVDIDMLRTPSYQFKASTTDPADRFVLSYKTGTNLFKEMDDRTEFGFFSNGSWMIDNEGEATLQVIDVNGRILSSETINGDASIKVDAAPGVYMLRLINGDSVKVQKVVVE